MTNAQIKYILDNYTTYTENTISVLEEVRYFTLLKQDNKICDRKLNRYRFKFIENDCLLYCYKCKEYDGSLIGLTEGVHYDKIGGKTYLYLLDENNKPIYDVLNGNEITQFILRKGSEL